MVVITHKLREALSFGDQVTVLDRRSLAVLARGVAGAAGTANPLPSYG